MFAVRVGLAVMLVALGCQPKSAAPASEPPGAPADAGPATGEPVAPGSPATEPEPDPQAEPAPASDAEPRPRLPGFAGPTAAELHAWDNPTNQPASEFDAANFDLLNSYFQDLQCFMRGAKAEGERAFGEKAGSRREEAWFEFKRGYVAEVNAWQQRLFADNPRIMERSRFLSTLLAAHELAIHGVLKAYNSSDRKAVANVEAQWAALENKHRKYASQLGEKAKGASKAHCLALKIR